MQVPTFSRVPEVTVTGSHLLVSLLRGEWKGDFADKIRKEVRRFGDSGEWLRTEECRLLVRDLPTHREILVSRKEVDVPLLHLGGFKEVDISQYGTNALPRLIVREATAGFPN